MRESLPNLWERAQRHARGGKKLRIFLAGSPTVAYGGELDVRGKVFVWRYDGLNRFPLAQRQEVINHSPDGFEWGYHGSGPAQLALAILVDFFGRDVTSATRLHQLFKQKVIARFGCSMPWSLTREEVSMHINNIRVTIQ